MLADIYRWGPHHRFSYNEDNSRIDFKCYKVMFIYLKQENSLISPFLTSSGRPTGPPPSYPPPPVPSLCQVRQDSNAGFHKGPPPPIPSSHRIPSSLLPKKPPVSSSPSSTLEDQNKGPAPPVPFAPHLHKPSSPTPPPLLPPNQKKPLPSRAASTGGAGNDKRDYRLPPTMSVQSPATLPICEQLEKRMVINGPAHCSFNVGGSQSLGNNHCVELSNLRSKPSIPVPNSANTGGSTVRPVMSNSLSPSQTSSSHPPLPGHSPHSPLLRPGLHNKPGITKPSPSPKPPVPGAKPKQLGAPFQ